MQSPQSGGLILSAQPVVSMAGAVFATTSTIPSIIQANTFQPQMVQVSHFHFNPSCTLGVGQDTIAFPFGSLFTQSQ